MIAEVRVCIAEDSKQTMFIVATYNIGKQYFEASPVKQMNRLAHAQLPDCKKRKNNDTIFSQKLSRFKNAASSGSSHSYFYIDFSDIQRKLSGQRYLHAAS